MMALINLALQQPLMQLYLNLCNSFFFNVSGHLIKVEENSGYILNQHGYIAAVFVLHLLMVIGDLFKDRATALIDVA